MQWGTIVGTQIGPNKDNTGDVLLVSVQVADDDDPQTVEVVMDAGVDYRPQIGALALVASINESDKVCIGIDDGITPDSAEGEHALYSTDGSTITKQATLKLTNDGSVLVNGGGRPVARIDDTTVCNATVDSEFFVWLNAVGSFIGTPPPLKFVCKIDSATMTCEVADD